jgi:hypothetical protein
LSDVAQSIASFVTWTCWLKAPGITPNASIKLLTIWCPM